MDSKAARAKEAHKASLALLSDYRGQIQLRNALIRQMHRDDQKWSYTRLASYFGLSREAIAKIVRGERVDSAA